MADNPLYLPEPEIQHAAKHGALVVFIGAGASMLCGSPNWVGFASAVVSSLEKRGVLSFLEGEQLRGLRDPRRTLSIAMDLARDKGLSIDFEGILHPSAAAQAAGAQLYKLLADLRPVFVTTNYDKWLDEAGPADVTSVSVEPSESEAAAEPPKRPVYFRREDLSPALLRSRGAVIHLHGSYQDEKSMVVTFRDYIHHYAHENVKAFLSAMLADFTVLFVGYSLEELELLEYVVLNNPSLRIGGKAAAKHFMLLPHRSTEQVQVQFTEHFMQQQCGIKVIPYCIDTKGYSELNQVFATWGPALDVRDPSLLDLQGSLDKFVASSSAPNRDAAIALVKRHPKLEAYLIGKLQSVEWFDDLDRAGFFSPRRSPQLVVVTDEQGTSFRADPWPALRFLELIASALEKEQQARALEIVRLVTSDAKTRKLDNFSTSFSLARIFSQLGLELMTDEDLDMVRVWLGGRFDNTLAGRELGEKLLPRLLERGDEADNRHALLLVDALTTLRPEKEPL